MTICRLDILLSQFGTSVFSMSISNCCFWLAYRFLIRQVRWSGILFSLRIFHGLLWSTIKGFSLVNEAEVGVLANQLQKFILTAAGSTDREPVLRWGCVAYGVLGVMQGSWGDLKVKHLQWPMHRSPDGVCGTVTRICVPWKPCVGSICCSLPFCCTAHLRFWDGATKKWESLAVACTTEDAGHSLTSSFSPVGVIVGQNGPS